MKVEIITIGDEILSGNILDTNTAYLSDRLWMQGIEVMYHTGIRDDADRIQEALLHAASRSDVVLVTGGLGPTADDFTIEIVAKTFGKKMVRDKEYLKYLTRLFASWGRELKENNKKQADVPKGAVTYQNRVGTAPGIGLDYQKTSFFFMPGVPKEMKQIFEDFVLKAILAKRKKSVYFKSKLLKLFGAAESDLDFALRDMYVNRLDIDKARISFRASFPETYIKISAWDKTAKAAQKTLDEVESKIRAKVGKYIYGENDDTLEAVVGNLLAQTGKTLATAESCTGGLIGDRLTNVPGSSGYYAQGAITYSNDAKVNLLGVKKSTIKKHGAVSSACAIEMAQGIRQSAGTDFGLAVTGIAGPGGGSRTKPVGTVHLALASAKDVWEKKYVLPRNRLWFKQLVASIALDRVRRALVKL